MEVGYWTTTAVSQTTPLSWLFGYQSKPTPNKPNSILPLPSDLRNRIADIVANKACATYINDLLQTVSKKTGKAFSLKAMDIFDRVNREAGFKLSKLRTQYGGEADFDGTKRVVYIQGRTSSGDSRVDEHTLNAYAVTALNELMHHARKSGRYGDRDLATGVFLLMSPVDQQNNPLPKSKDHDVNSQYFHSHFKLRCR